MNDMNVLNDLIVQFLADKRLSENSGYAIPADDDISTLTRIIIHLIAMKFEPDPDGHRPISIRLIDRTKGHFPFFKAIPHNSDIAWTTALHNLRIATEIMEQHLKTMDMRKE